MEKVVRKTTEWPSQRRCSAGDEVDDSKSKFFANPKTNMKTKFFSSIKIQL